MSTKCGCTSSGSYAHCAGFHNQTVPDDIAARYADRVGAPKGKDNATTCSVWSLCRDVNKVRRIPYYADNPGDCGTDKKVSIAGAGLSKGISIGGTGAGLVASAGSVGALGVGGAITAVATWASFGAGLALLPLAIIGHHSAEVALEKKTLCSVASGYNGFADQVDSGLQNGTVTLDQAMQLADQIQQQIITALAQGLKQCNARCYYTYAIKSLTLLNKEVSYPMLASQFKSQQQQQQQLQPAAPSSTSGTGTALTIGGLALAVIAKIAGLF